MLKTNKKTHSRALAAPLGITHRCSNRACNQLFAGSLMAQSVLTIESWRTDDQAIWDEKILPVFKAAYPDIDVKFSPTKPTEYDAAMNAKMEGGTAGDIVTCRPFDRALNLYKAGHLKTSNRWKD